MHYLILGFGLTGQSVFKYLLCAYNTNDDLVITIYDQNSSLNIDHIISDLSNINSNKLKYQHVTELGSIAKLHRIKNIDLAIASPGLKPSLYKPFLEQELSIKIISDVQLFINNLHLEQNYKNIFAITGTNGKSTVCALLNCLLSHSNDNTANNNTALVGNYGLPVTDLLLETNINIISNLVMELSSYQLELTDYLPALIAVCLNISPDHLDWHQGFNNYLNAKLKIYANSRFDLINIDQPLLLEQYKNSIFKNKIDNNKDFKLILYSSDLNNQHNLENIKLEFNSIKDNIVLSCLWLANKDEELCIYLDHKKIITGNNIPTNLLTKHNISNLLSVIGMLLASIIDTKNSLSHIYSNNTKDLYSTELILTRLNFYLKYLGDFKTLPFRCELLDDTNNIKIFNDSKATNLDATLSALDSLVNLDANKLILILGGMVKEDIDDQACRTRFIELISKYGNTITNIIIASKDKNSQEKLYNLVTAAVSNANNINIFKYNELDLAINKSIELANSNDSILFSPGGASFDSYKSYIERGHEFNKIVYQQIKAIG
jgi:UDP-N-acetylmuramoylalanine--D-glutamate ligase